MFIKEFLCLPKIQRWMTCMEQKNKSQVEHISRSAENHCADALDKIKNQHQTEWFWIEVKIGSNSRWCFIFFIQPKLFFYLKKRIEKNFCFEKRINFHINTIKKFSWDWQIYNFGSVKVEHEESWARKVKHEKRKISKIQYTTSLRPPPSKIYFGPGKSKWAEIYRICWGEECNGYGQIFSSISLRFEEIFIK